MMRSLMYLRPGNLYKDFVVEESGTKIGSSGRPRFTSESSGEKMLRGALAQATDNQKLEWQQLQHPISHTIVQNGRPRAKVEDRLIHGDRIFLIQGVDEPGSIGLCTIYYVEERFDAE